MERTDRPRTVAELFGVPLAPRNARDRLLQTAIELFSRHGFHAVGLDRVIAAVGVTKTTFYKHFESKDDLVLAAVRERDDWETGAWRRALAEVGGDDPRAKLIGMFDVLDVWFRDADFVGCMFINVAAEFPNPNDPVHQAAAEHKRKARDDVRDLAAAAGASDPERFADVYTMLLEGTLVLRQVHLREDAALLARPVVEKLLEESIP